MANVNPDGRDAPVIMVDETVTTHAANGAAPRKGFEAEALADITKQITIEFAGMTGDIWYKPWRLTPRILRNINKQAKEDADGDGFVARMVCEWVSAWELTVHGEPCPITPMALEANFPARFIRAIFDGIIEDMTPTPTTGAVSSTG